MWECLSEERCSRMQSGKKSNGFTNITATIACTDFCYGILVVGQLSCCVQLTKLFISESQVFDQELAFRLLVVPFAIF